MKLSNIMACMLRYFYATRDYSRLFEFFVWPVIDIGWLGFIALWAGSLANEPKLVTVFVLALVLWQVIYRANYEICFNILDEVLDHNLVNMIASPLKKSEWIISMMLSGLIKSIGTLLFGSLIGYLFFGVNIFSMGVMLIPFTFLCVLSGWVIGFMAGGVILLKGAKLQQIPWIAIMIAAVLSAVLYPAAILPEPMLILSKSLPMSYIFEGMRQLMQDGTLSMDYLWVSSFLSIVYLAISIVVFLWFFEKSRMTGLDRLT